MVQVSAKITLEEFLKLPETKPYSEYINGQVIQKPMPQGKHSKLQGELITAINAIAKPQKIAFGDKIDGETIIDENLWTQIKS